MSAQQHEISAPGGPVRRESALQRQMAEFDAKKASSRSVSYSDDTRDHSPSSKRNGTPHPKGVSPHAPPSPDRDGQFAHPSRRSTHSPPRSDEEPDYKQNIRTTGGNGRDKEEKWVGNNLPRPGVHGAPEGDFEYADNLKVTGGRGKDTTVEWHGKEAPRITHHHKWTSENEEEEEDQSASRKKKAPKSKKYKNAAGDYVEEADGSDNEINAHHTWKPDSEAQANYKPEKSKKSKSKSKSSKRSSREYSDEAHFSGDESEQRFQGPARTKSYIDANGDEVLEAADPDNLKINHNHQWTD